MYAWDGLKKLRLSVAYKKLQLEKEKLHMKLNYILYSQVFTTLFLLHSRFIQVH